MSRRSKPPFKLAGSSASVAPTSPPKRPHCGICNRDFDDNRGFKSHYEKCLQQKEDAQKDKDYVRKVEARRNKGMIARLKRPPSQLKGIEPSTRARVACEGSAKALGTSLPTETQYAVFLGMSLL
jgi:hypothetical protein